MKFKVYTNNPYYQLLIYLLIKFGITDFDITKLRLDDPALLEKLDKEAINEMALVQEFNRKYDPLKFYEFARKFEIEMDFPSLIDITTFFLVDNKIPVYEPVVKSMEQSIAKFEKFKSNLVFNDERINFVTNLRKNESLSFFQTMVYENYWQNYLSLLVVNMFGEVVPTRWRSLRYQPIELAAMLGNASLMENFLALNKDEPKFWTEENPHLLNLACGYNNMETFERLLLYPHRLDELSTLQEAQRKELQVRANQGRFNNDQTLLHVACELKNPAVVKLLLTVGATVHKMDGVGELPLHTAVKAGARKIVSLLWEDYEKNNNLELAIKATDNNGRALIHFASQVKDFEDTVENILSFDHELVKTVDNFGFTALHYACSAGLIKMAEILVANGAKVMAMSNTLRRDTPYALISSNIAKEDKEKLEKILAEKHPEAFKQDKFVRRLTGSKTLTFILLLSMAAAGAGGGSFAWWLFTFLKLANLTFVAILFGVVLSGVGFGVTLKCVRSYEARGLRSAAQKEAEADEEAEQQEVENNEPKETTPLLPSTYANFLSQNDSLHQESTVTQKEVNEQQFNQEEVILNFPGEDYSKEEEEEPLQFRELQPH